MKENQTDKINFRINTLTKKQFQRVCRSRRQQMTTILNLAVYEYLKNNEEIEADGPLVFYVDD